MLSAKCLLNNLTYIFFTFLLASNQESPDTNFAIPAPAKLKFIVFSINKNFFSFEILSFAYACKIISISFFNQIDDSSEYKFFEIKKKN